MDLILFLVFLIITLGGYYAQYDKIYKHKSSYGVSFNAYIISFIATSSLFINSYSQKDYVFILAIIELVLLIIGLFLIYKYKQEPLEKLSTSFIIALTFSFFMIHKYFKAIKNYNTKGKINVSISSYLLFIILDLIIIYLTTNQFIKICSSITIIVFIYIIIDTYIKNHHILNNDEIRN